MEYGEFVEGYKKGTIRFGVDRSKISRTATSELYQQFFNEPDYPRMLKGLSTVFSLLVIPSILAGLVTPFLLAWWAFVPCLGFAWIFSRMSYRYQREAVREFALANESAYKFLVLEGIIVIEEPGKD